MSERAPRDGKLITFYSYKGGTGRTMLLSNIAWILASNGLKILVIDWDLEAPGLHRYLRPFLIDKELLSTPGLIDFAWDAAKEVVTPQGPNPTDEDNGSAISILDYVVGLDWTFRGDGLIDFIPAGRQTEDYAQKVNTFNWDNFYERLGGGKLLQAARQALRDEYDFVLIDSRTGVSDTSSICTVQMPDQLVLCFTLNSQSIFGSRAIATSIRAQKGDAFPIFPVPTRIENAETDKVDRAIRVAKANFTSFLPNVVHGVSASNNEQSDKYWSDIQVPYRTFYAFDEIPATFKDPAFGHDTILASTERLASHLLGRDVSLIHDEPAVREGVVRAFYDDREKLPAQSVPAAPDIWSKIKSPSFIRGLKLAAAGVTLFSVATAGGAWVLVTINRLSAQVLSQATTIETQGSTINQLTAQVQSLNDSIQDKEKENTNLKSENTNLNTQINYLRFQSNRNLLAFSCLYSTLSKDKCKSQTRGVTPLPSYGRW